MEVALLSQIRQSLEETNKLLRKQNELLEQMLAPTNVTFVQGIRHD